MTVLLAHIRRYAAAWVFAAVAGAAVSLFCAVVPTGWGLDEQSHVARAYQVSRAIPLPYVREDGKTLGASVPEKIMAVEAAGFSASNGVDRGAPSWQRADFSNRAQVHELNAQVVERGDPTVDYDVSNASASSFVPYLPAAVGMRVGSVLGADVGTTMLLAKLLNGLVFVALGTIAVAVLAPFRARWLFFVVGLLPETVFQAAYVTADSYTDGIALLFAAAVTRLAVDRRPVSVTLLVGTVAAALGMAAAKPTYVVLVLALLAIPGVRMLPGRLADRVGRPALVGKAVAAGMIVAVGAVALVVLRLVGNSTVAIAATYDRGADSGAQVEYLLHHPLHVPVVLWRTVEVFGLSWTESLTGNFGYNTVHQVEPFVTMCIVTVVLAAFHAERLRRVVGLTFLVGSLVAGFAVIGALYLTFNAPGDPMAVGVQGRYFIPLLAPFVLGLAALVPVRLAMRERHAAIVFPVLSTVALLASGVLWLSFLY
ncbi:DUF2142 domain-containing protein [Curtobacterium oceanosedimentum]|uniref:DUF2142 domain-containing protein n=1 Tax=Curtobacterium oceanosedimentum TaxID=465820 RepID=A0A147DNZ9_9MICO|nr:DUF2142 domain-containing protein [Curtobacterium oceanosedimentum]KTR50959.1 hypothetical protein NS359_12595 [Curtobacterium oceanosedimentum]